MWHALAVRHPEVLCRTRHLTRRLGSAYCRPCSGGPIGGCSGFLRMIMLIFILLLYLLSPCQPWAYGRSWDDAADDLFSLCPPDERLRIPLGRYKSRIV